MSTTEKKKPQPSRKTKPVRPREADQALASSTDAVGDESVDRIRDILFGAQMRDYDKRFRDLESRLLQESEDLRKEVSSRVQALENYLKSELNGLLERSRAEEQIRSESLEAVKSELGGVRATLDKRISAVDTLVTEATRDLRQQILDQSRDLSSEIKRKSDQLLEKLKAEIKELRAEKTDRAALASMFAELALRLNEEFKLPEPD